MYFNSWSEFFAMGGYAEYVWSAFGITFFSMGFLWVLSVRAGRGLLQDVQKKINRQARIEAAKNMENTL
ncbi:heme exporter protein CcmD [Vibrio sp.]|uniref:heme exporter protein CcmD n=1 Tax=Vibrio sp. TaxID=678 RepID=UPI003D0D9087